NDTLLGAAGDDSLAGSAGSDLLDGGAGNDSLDGGSGNDTLHGGAGDDSLAGAAGGDTLDGEAGNDSLDAGAGDDTLNGGAGDDNLVGGAGNDTLEGGSGNDSLAGGTGDDNYVYAGGNDTLVEAGGNDTLSIASGQTVTDAYKDGTNIFLVMASGATITLKDFYAGGGAIEKLDYATLSKIYTIVTGNTGGSADEMIAGTTGDETFNGNGGDDLVFAHGGNDTITASAGNDTYYGGAGNDTIDYSFITSGITADLSSGVITGLGSDHVSSVEHVVTGDGNDILTGDSADNRLYGNNGNDTLDGGAGNDTLIGGADDDSYVHSGGNDTIIDSSGDDTLKLGASDTIQNASTNGTDLFITLQSGDTITVSQHYSGSKDVETLDYTSLSKTYTIQADDSGGAGNDLVAGSDSDDDITTGAGDDLVFANGGNDTITAGSGNDTYYGGSGDDTIVYDITSNGITADLSTGIITGLGSDLVNSVEHVVGSEGNDTLTGNSGGNRLFGDKGNDTLVGGDGDDTLDGGNDNDLADYSAATAGVTVDLSSGQASGGAGNDSLLNIENVLGSNFDDTLVADASGHLLGGNGNDLLTTSADESDTFEGGAGNDTLQSGSGTDTLVGGAGDDLLQGGVDNDSYLYNLGDGNDTIDDTAGATDTLILDAATSFDSAARVGDNLVLTVNGGATIVLKDHYNGQPLESLDVGALSTVYNILTGLTGSPSNELIVSGTSGDVMSGGSGNDHMFGGGGNDQVNGNNGNDRVYGGAGDDTVSGGSGNDTVSGDGGNDYVAGGAGTDTLYGGTGNDTVAGGAGNDIIYLGAGNDTVYYDAVSHVGDTIMDFDPTNDVFSFNGTDFGALLGGSISASNFVSTTNLPSGSDGLASTPTFIFFDNPSGNDALYYDEDGLLGGFTVTKVAEFNGSLSGFDHNNIAIASGQA
ncbi:MAG: calcium-binding protein, partial [Rhodospirillales bacterium]